MNFTHDAVGNRASRALTLGGSTATETYTYPASSNLIGSVDLGGMITRTFSHDASGNMRTDFEQLSDGTSVTLFPLDSNPHHNRPVKAVHRSGYFYCEGTDPFESPDYQFADIHRFCAG